MEKAGRAPEREHASAPPPADVRRTWDFGEFRLDEAERRLTRAGAPVSLTPKSFDLLLFLVERPGSLVRKDEIMQRLWPDTFVEEGTLARHVSSLRSALGDRATEAALIQTVHKSGYRFAGTVRAAMAPREARKTVHELAILPFRPLLPSSDDHALELGLADSLIARLSSFEELSVRSLSAVRRFVESHTESLEAGRQLRVDAVLEGTLQREGDRVRLNARLLQVHSGRALWSRTFEQHFQSLFALEDAVADEVGAALAPALEAAPAVRVARPAPADAGAYELYLRGRHFWSRRTEDALKRALAYFDEALARDGALGCAHAARADALTLLAGYGVPERAFEEARRSAARALELDPDSADAHAVEGLIAQKCDRRWTEAEAAYKRALQIHPQHVTALQRYGELLALRGRSDEGLALLERVRQMDPTSLILGSDRAKALFFARRYDEAILEGQAVLELDATFARARLYLGLALLFAGEQPLALTELAAFVKRDGSAYARGIEAYASGVAGQTEVARDMLTGLQARARREYVTPYAFALAHLGLREHDEALTWLARIVDQGHNVLGLDISPLMDPLREDARFLRLLERAQLLAPRDTRS